MSTCPCCGGERYVELQDKVYLDWSKDCLDCGYVNELMPRSASRDQSDSFRVTTDSVVSGLGDRLTIASCLEDLFPEFAQQ